MKIKSEFRVSWSSKVSDKMDLTVYTIYIMYINQPFIQVTTMQCRLTCLCVPQFDVPVIPTAEELAPWVVEGDVPHCLFVAVIGPYAPSLIVHLPDLNNTPILLKLTFSTLFNANKTHVIALRVFKHWYNHTISFQTHIFYFYLVEYEYLFDKFSCGRKWLYGFKCSEVFVFCHSSLSLCAFHSQYTHPTPGFELGTLYNCF